jgi:hypothetical protein
VKSWVLELRDRHECYVNVTLTGFPPNAPVELSMIAFKDDLFYGFLNDQFYDYLHVDEQGQLVFLMGPVWVPRDVGVQVRVIPFASTQVTGSISSTDDEPLYINEVCNPNL